MSMVLLLIFDMNVLVVGVVMVLAVIIATIVVHSVEARIGVDLTGGVARVRSGTGRFTVVLIATVPLARTVGVLDVVLTGAVRAGGLTLT